MSWKNTLICAPLLFIAACQSAPKIIAPSQPLETQRPYHSVGNYSGGETFPPGIYQQKISIETKEGKSFLFFGYLKVAPEKIEIAGISQLSTTIFHIEDIAGPKHNFSIDPKIEIYMPELQARREYVTQFYSALRPLLFMKDTQGKEMGRLVIARHEDGRPKEISTSPKKTHDLKILIDSYADSGLLESFRILHPKWTANILLRKYETTSANP